MNDIDDNVETPDEGKKSRLATFRERIERELFGDTENVEDEKARIEREKVESRGKLAEDIEEKTAEEKMKLPANDVMDESSENIALTEEKRGFFARLTDLFSAKKLKNAWDKGGIKGLFSFFLATVSGREIISDSSEYIENKKKELYDSFTKQLILYTQKKVLPEGIQLSEDDVDMLLDIGIEKEEDLEAALKKLPKASEFAESHPILRNMILAGMTLPAYIKLVLNVKNEKIGNPEADEVEPKSNYVADLENENDGERFKKAPTKRVNLINGDSCVFECNGEKKLPVKIERKKVKIGKNTFNVKVNGYGLTFDEILPMSDGKFKLTLTGSYGPMSQTKVAVLSQAEAIAMMTTLEENAKKSHFSYPITSDGENYVFEFTKA